MTHSEVSSHEAYPDPHHDTTSKTLFGFWVYLLTDFMLFATLFASYAVLSKNLFGHPSPAHLFKLPYTLVQTLILLVSSFTIGIAGTLVRKKSKGAGLIWLVITFILGIAFMLMEFNEFARLIKSGNSWHESAFLSAYFTLVGTHAIHMLIALLWVIVLILPVLLAGLTPVNIKRLTCLTLFWNFLNVIWVFIFTVVYLMGVNYYA